MENLDVDLLVFIAEIILAMVASPVLLQVVNKTKDFFGWSGKLVQTTAVIWAVIWAIAEVALSQLVDPNFVWDFNRVLLIGTLAWGTTEAHYRALKDKLQGAKIDAIDVLMRDTGN